jgi:hypothetical protein
MIMNTESMVSPIEALKSNPVVAAVLGLNEPAPRETKRNRRGVMTYSSKDTASLQIFTNESWERNKHYYQPRGARSCVKNFSRNICR